MKLIYKNLLLIALCFIFLTNLSCNGVVKDFETKNIQNPRQGKSEKAGSEKEFSEIYINGTDAGTYFQTLYKLNKYDEMIQITCTESLRKFGTAAVLEYYKNQMSFAYELGKLTAIIENTDKTKTLIYNSKIMATKMKTEITIVKEEDIIKIVLPNKLNNFPIIK